MSFVFSRQGQLQEQGGCPLRVREPVCPEASYGETDGNTQTDLVSMKGINLWGWFGLIFCMMLQEYASTVRRIAQSSSMNMKDRLTIELHRKLLLFSCLVDLCDDSFFLFLNIQSFFTCQSLLYESCQIILVSKYSIFKCSPNIKLWKVTFLHKMLQLIIANVLNLY